MISSYIGKVIAKQIVNIIKKYKIENNLKYFVFDNVISNNICIETIFNII